MAINTRLKKFLDCFGTDSVLANAQITLNTTAIDPTITENQGFTSIVRTSAGLYTFTLARKPKAFNVTFGLGCAAPGATYQPVMLIAKNVAAGTFTVRCLTSVSSATAVDPTVALLLDVQVLERIAV